MLEAPHHPPQAEQLGRERQAEQQRRYWRGQRDGVMLIAVESDADVIDILVPAHLLELREVYERAEIVIAD